MREQKFPWKRFWCHPDGLLRVEPDGFLIDCESKYGRMMAPEVKSFEEIETTHCLILLGEPGIGKSTAIHDETLRIRQSVESEKPIMVNLKEYGNEELLWKDLFESARWQEYGKGQCKLQLFLDSLDEVRIRIHNVQSLLLRGLRDGPLENLFLRIACRTSEWPSSFHDQLCTLWSSDTVQVYELAPLTRNNAMQAARYRGIDPDGFIRTVHEKQIGALASKPITLKFLLDLYSSQGDFPTGQVELYRQGCLYLCEEPDKERREKRDISKLYSGFLSAKERLAVASRIAAVLTFSNRYAVYRNGSSHVPEGCLPLGQLVGGSQVADGKTVDVSEDAVRDALKTGLFSSRGAEVFGFVHQTYQEHLTALYVDRAELRQIKELLTHPYDGDGIVPQLQETAACISAVREDVMQWLMSIEPEIVLRSDLSGVDVAGKEKLVRELMTLFSQNRLFDDLSLRDNYHKVAYSGIIDQIKPIIESKTATFVARRAAIGISEACGVINLQGVLADLALNASEDETLRARAAQAVSEIADRSTRRRLEPLAKGESGTDPDDQLKGWGLCCMWPGNWNVSQLFENLTPVKNKSFVGAYNYFLRYQAPKHFNTNGTPVEQITHALSITKTWISDNSGYDHHSFGRIYNALLRLSFQHIPNPLLMTELSNHILLYADHGPFPEHYDDEDSNPWTELGSQHQERYHLAKHMVANGMVKDRGDAISLLFGESTILQDSDFPWLLAEVEKTVGAEQSIWASLILFTINPEIPVLWIDSFLEARCRIPILQNEYPVYWELDSDLSKRSKEAHAERVRREQRATRLPKISSAAKRIEPLLKDIEEGKVDRWFVLTDNLWINVETGEQGHLEGFDIKKSPGWKTLDSANQVRIEQAASKFISDYSPPPDDWFGKGSWDSDVSSICMALLLISEQTPVVGKITDTERMKWIPYMVDNYAFIDDASSSCRLFSFAYQLDPEATKQYLVRLLKNMDQRDKYIHDLGHLRGCWNSDLSTLLIDFLGKYELNTPSFVSVVEHLIGVGSAEIEGIVIDRLREQDRKNHQELTISLVLILLYHWADKYWSDIWTFLNQDKELALNILGHIEPGYRQGTTYTSRLNETQLGELYILMCDLWPVEEDPPWGSGTFTERHRVAELRGNVFMALVNRGTKEACDTIQSLSDRFLDQRLWMLFRLKEAKANYYTKTWNPPSPEEVISLLSSNGKRYVEHESELIEVVLESLSKLQHRCQDSSLPAVRNYWNYQGSGNKRSNFRPKDEEDLSDNITDWLREDLGPARGIIVNREVQPRRGKKTDIYINAVSLTDGNINDTLTIVVEVKGCWSKNLCKAMETQLFNDYMKRNGFAYGVYLVGWYLCDLWDGDDYRKKDTKTKGLQELIQSLSEQATSIAVKNPMYSRIEPFVLDLTLE